MAVSLELLTDEAILDYTRSEGRDHVVFNHRDINLRSTGVNPYPGGVFDINIFGSPYRDRCLCGNLKQPSKEPCPNCGCRVFTQEEALRRFGRLELPFYYLNDLRLETFLELFDEIFKDTKIVKELIGDDLKRGGYSSSKGGKKLGIKVFDSCQFEYDPKAKELKITEFITDESKCSYEGLMKIIEEHFPSYLRDYRSLINHYYLILPTAMRPFTIRISTDPKTGKSKKLLGNHPMTIWYSILIRLCCVEDDDPDSTGLNYNEVMSRYKTPGERVRYTALLRAFINAGKKMSTKLLNTSKENLARELYSIRTKNSARCPIVPSTDLPIDEVGIPRSLAYEMMKEGFAQFLCDELNFTKKQALRSVKKEALDENLQEYFKQYAEKQFVLITRPPALHEYSTYCMKVKLTDEYALALPIQVCEPFNA